MIEDHRLTGGHIIGYATNATEAVATSAFCIEIVCHHGGPRLVIGVYPVSKINVEKARDILMEIN